MWWVGRDDLIGLFPVQFIWFSFPNAERWEGRWWAAGVRDWPFAMGAHVFLGCDSAIPGYFN